MNVVPYTSQSGTACCAPAPTERPCVETLAVNAVPVGTVICATVTARASPSPAGPFVGAIQNSAPSLISKPASGVQESQSMPTELRAPAESPSVSPTVNHESYGLSGEAAANKGLVPPAFAPNGAATWKAPGMDIVPPLELP